VKRYTRRALHGVLVAAARTRPVAVPPAALDCIVARNSYGVYCVPRACSQRPAAQALLESRIWEADTLELMRAIPGDVVHAGTFFGDFLPALASSRDDTVWAFEPNRESHRCAQITAELNDLANVHLVNAALSDASGACNLAVTNAAGVPSGGGSRLKPDPLDGEVVELVPLVTVDEVVPADRNVGVIELDVEGHEQQALLGALGVIARCRPVVIVEQAPAAGWLREHLPEYRVSDKVNGNSVLTHV